MVGYEIKIDDVCMWILLLLCISIKTPCCWAQMTFVCWEPALNRRVLLLWNCDAQWRIQFLISACIKSDAMCRDTYNLNLNSRAWDVRVVWCNIVPCVIWIWICAIPVQSWVCNNRGLFFATLLTANDWLWVLCQQTFVVYAEKCFIYSTK